MQHYQINCLVSKMLRHKRQKESKVPNLFNPFIYLLPRCVNRHQCVYFSECVLLCFVLTGWESMIFALWLVSCAADGLQVDAVVGATSDASHQAVVVQSVALSMSAWRCQRGDVGASAAARWPGHVGYGLGDLGHIHIGGAARTSESGKKREQRLILE